MSTVTNAVNTAATAATTATTAANSVTGATSGAAGSKNASAVQGLNSTYQEFLQLLTTELNNQDPTAPMDPTQMINQLTGLSQVEQQIQTNTEIQQLVSAFTASQVSNAVSYIGKEVNATGNQVALSSSQAALVYNLPSGTSSATVTITDSSGATVFSGPGTTLAGRNQVLWNGSNSTTGATQPDGTYTFSVAAKDSSGKALTATTYTSGTVTAVDTANGTNSLALGSGISVPITNVQEVYNAGTNPGA